MTSEREALFNRLHQALDQRPDRAPYPEYDDQVVTAEPRLTEATLWEDFARNFQAVSGRPMTALPEMTAFLGAQDVSVGYCDPALMDPIGKACVEAGLVIHTTYDRERYDDYQFGITRASGAIAETGTVVLTDNDTSDRLGALTPWIHVAVLPQQFLCRTIADAIKTFGGEGNIIWATGPSKTADVEGILIEGVHGPGEQLCLRVDS